MFSLNEFIDDDVLFNNVLEATHFMGLPLVFEAVRELVEAHRENEAILASQPPEVQDARERLR